MALSLDMKHVKMLLETLQSSDALLSEQQRTCSDYEPTINGTSSSMCLEDEVSLKGPYDRMLGDTEHNWCRAVSVGTGITVLGFLFKQPLNLSDLQIAIDVVQLQHPRLRSQLLWIHGRPAFQVCNKPIVKVVVVEKQEESERDEVVSDEVDSAPSENVVCDLPGEAQQHSTPTSNGECDARGWLKFVEDELNINIWPQREHCAEPVQLFVVHLYHLPENRSLMILRLHTAACDRVSAATVSTDVLKALFKISRGELAAPDVSDDAEADVSQPLQQDTGKEDQNSGFGLPPVEETIPPGKANKPFWAHGIDLLGYSLGSRRHALLPFLDSDSPRRTALIRSSLSFDHTQALLQACTNAEASLYGALCAAGLKAAAAAKNLGNRAEHYAVISLVDCRKYLEPSISDSTVGFYHSALMLTHHLNEKVDFWELAKRCSGSLDNAMNNRKHFTDMGDLNYLMYQAISRPHLTPSSSLRTSLLVTFRDTLSDDLSDWATALGVEDFVGCSSIHGVGPSLAIFDAIRNGELHCANVFPAPLHSRAQMQAYVDTMMSYLVEFLS